MFSRYTPSDIKALEAQMRGLYHLQVETSHLTRYHCDKKISDFINTVVKVLEHL